VVDGDVSARNVLQALQLRFGAYDARLRARAIFEQLSSALTHIATLESIAVLKALHELVCETVHRNSTLKPYALHLEKLVTFIEQRLEERIAATTTQDSS
jgi:hypothetical protein